MVMNNDKYNLPCFRFVSYVLDMRHKDGKVSGIYMLLLEVESSTLLLFRYRVGEVGIPDGLIILHYSLRYMF